MIRNLEGLSGVSSEGEERGKAVCCRMSKDTKKREGDRMATIGPRDNIVLQ